MRKASLRLYQGAPASRGSAGGSPKWSQQPEALPALLRGKHLLGGRIRHGPAGHLPGKKGDGGHDERTTSRPPVESGPAPRGFDQRAVPGKRKGTYRGGGESRLLALHPEVLGGTLLTPVVDQQVQVAQVGAAELGVAPGRQDALDHQQPAVVRDSLTDVAQDREAALVIPVMEHGLEELEASSPRDLGEEVTVGDGAPVRDIGAPQRLLGLRQAIGGVEEYPLQLRVLPQNTGQ